MSRRLLLVAHGYPPDQAAGTEQHAATVAAGLRARGWEVGVLAATRDPARRQYEVVPGSGPSGEPTWRLVQNLPARPLSQGEADPAVEAAARRVVASFEPDLVHVHHLQFLSSGLRFPVPTALTLHDRWLWCAAGGQGVELPARRPCPGPTPERCAPCAAAWAPTPRPAARALLGIAGRLAGHLRPDHLHRAFRAAPAPLRRRLQAPARGRSTEPATAARRRAEAMADFARSCALRLAPSAHLADLATAQGLGPVGVLPHGLAPTAGGPLPSERDGPLLFLGTVAWHKGPDLVVEAWRRAFPDGEPGLVVHGPVQDPALVPSALLGGPLDRSGVQAALRGARALVLGSRWEENAPLVVLEARQAGCPVVVPDSGGLPELVTEGVDGWRYPQGDVEALAACLRAVVRAPLAAPPRPPPTLEAHLDALEAHYARLLSEEAP